MNRNYLIKQLGFIIASFALALFLVYLLFGSKVLNNAFDLHIHDTYFVLSSWIAIIILFIITLFAIFFLKEFRYKHKRVLPNFIILLSGLLLAILLLYGIRILGSLDTDYAQRISLPTSSTSTLNESTVVEHNQLSPTLNSLNSILSAVQIIIILILLYVSYRWGQKKHNS